MSVQVDVTGGTLEGTAPGTTISGIGTCLGLCTNVITDFPTQPLEAGVMAGGQMTFLSGVTAQGQIADTTSDTFFTLNHVGKEGELWTPVEFNAADDPPLIRCDNALPGVNQVGCVFPDRAPTLQYSRDGLFPQLARHIGDAQASGLPGAQRIKPSRSREG